MVHPCKWYTTLHPGWNVRAWPKLRSQVAGTLSKRSQKRRSRIDTSAENHTTHNPCAGVYPAAGIAPCRSPESPRYQAFEWGEPLTAPQTLAKKKTRKKSTPVKTCASTYPSAAVAPSRSSNLPTRFAPSFPPAGGAKTAASSASREATAGPGCPATAMPHSLAAASRAAH